MHDCPPNSKCVNTKGSYTCECEDGFDTYIDPNGVNPMKCFEGCSKKDVCSHGAVCTNLIEPPNFGYQCTCPDSGLNTEGNGYPGFPCINKETQQAICDKPENAVEFNMYSNSKFKILTRGQCSVVYRIRLPRVPETTDYTGFFAFGAEFCGADFVQQLGNGIMAVDLHDRKAEYKIVGSYVGHTGNTGNIS